MVVRVASVGPVVEMASWPLWSAASDIRPNYDVDYLELIRIHRGLMRDRKDDGYKVRDARFLVFLAVLAVMVFQLTVEDVQQIAEIEAGRVGMLVSELMEERP